MTHNRAGEIALAIYERVLAEVRADRLIRRAVLLEDDALLIEARTPSDRPTRAAVPLRDYSRVFLCGAGKAAVGMAAALEGMLGDRLSGGLVVTKRGDGARLDRIEVVESGHPVPDSDSLEAGRRMHDLASSLRSDDLMLFCLSGGASSLMELPVEGVDLDGLRALTDGLLRQQFDIRQINAVRSRLSQIKGGGLARAAAKGSVVCFVLSDVLGNDLSTIGSGPLYDARIQHDPYAIVRTAGLLDLLPSSAQARLRSLAEEPFDADRQYPRHFIVGSNRTALEAAELAAVQLGLDARVHDRLLTGEAAVEGLQVARDIEMGVCQIYGGEPLVAVRGDGKGGRCQELACAAAGVISGQKNAAVLAAGTDGTDGPTDAAGAVVDGHTVQRAAECGVDVEEALSRNDSYAFHRAAETLIVTGPTQSNVNDVVLSVGGMG